MSRPLSEEGRLIKGLLAVLAENGVPVLHKVVDGEVLAVVVPSMRNREDFTEEQAAELWGRCCSELEAMVRSFRMAGAKEVPDAS